MEGQFSPVPAPCGMMERLAQAQALDRQPKALTGSATTGSLIGAWAGLKGPVIALKLLELHWDSTNRQRREALAWARIWRRTSLRNYLLVRVLGSS